MNKPEPREIKKFALTMAAVLMIISLILFFRQKNFLGFLILSVGFFLTALTAPGILRPFYFFWMKLAFVLNWINTRLILLLMFYLIFMPLGIILKLSGKDLLDLKLEKDKNSYWKKKEKSALGLNQYEKQF